MKLLKHPKQSLGDLASVRAAAKWNRKSYVPQFSLQMAESVWCEVLAVGASVAALRAYGSAWCVNLRVFQQELASRRERLHSGHNLLNLWHIERFFILFQIS